MNAYFAISSIFLLGLRGIEKKMKLPGPPVSHFTPEDKKTGKVCTCARFVLCSPNSWYRSRCWLRPSSRRRRR